MIVIPILLIMFFAFASSIKLVGWHKAVFDTQLAFFKSYGLNRQAMFLVGVVELSAVVSLAVALVLSIPIATAFGAALIALTSIGAIFFHLRFDTFSAAIPAITTLSLSVVLLWSNSTVFAGLF